VKPATAGALPPLVMIIVFLPTDKMGAIVEPKHCKQASLRDQQPPPDTDHRHTGQLTVARRDLVGEVPAHTQQLGHLGNRESGAQTGGGAHRLATFRQRERLLVARYHGVRTIPQCYLPNNR